MSAIEEVLAYLKKNPTYFLATVDEEGNPQVRPFGTATLFDGKLYIETGRSKSVFKQMAAHPRVACAPWMPKAVGCALKRTPLRMTACRRARHRLTTIPSSRICTLRMTGTAPCWR